MVFRRFRVSVLLRCFNVLGCVNSGLRGFAPLRDVVKTVLLQLGSRLSVYLKPSHFDGRLCRPMPTSQPWNNGVQIHTSCFLC